MGRHWLYLLKEYGEIYGSETISLKKGYLYFVVEGCVLVHSKTDGHVLFLVRKRACLNIEVIAHEVFVYQYSSVGNVRLLCIHRDKMQALFMNYPKLMPRMLRQGHYVLDQMILFAKLYQRNCQEEEIMALYHQLQLSFSYELFKKYVINDILPNRS